MSQYRDDGPEQGVKIVSMGKELREKSPKCLSSLAFSYWAEKNNFLLIIDLMKHFSFSVRRTEQKQYYWKQ